MMGLLRRVTEVERGQKGEDVGLEEGHQSSMKYMKIMNATEKMPPTPAATCCP